MLRLNKISLIQFKNYHNRTIEFTGGAISISGRNGIGKTNLLDAIHYLCFTKSHFTRLDNNNISQGFQGFRLQGDFDLWGKSEKAVCVLRETGKKEFSINDQLYDKFSQHIGHYPCVIITPDDIQVITNGSGERRRFLDTLLSQLDGAYLQQLISYYKILQQRNSLLRSFTETGNKNVSLLTVLDEQLLKSGDKIFERRKEFLISFLPLAKQLYNEIARHSHTVDNSLENINLFYSSELLHASFSELLTINESKDWASARTTSGIHKDDLHFEMNDRPFKNMASQGQRKSLLFALKIAEMEVLKKQKDFPLLLLDDVFEKLDEQRISNLLQRVCLENDGQIFITDTDQNRIKQHLSGLDIAYQLIQL